MTTVAKLLTRKQKLLERLREDPGPAELSEIDRQLAEIDQALDLIEGVGVSGAADRPTVQPSR